MGLIVKLLKRNGIFAAAVLAAAVLAPTALADVQTDCCNYLAAGTTCTAGSNYSITAACEAELSYNTYKIGGYNTGTPFTGHLEFDFYGQIYNTDDTTYSYARYKLDIANAPTCATGVYSTTLWRYNGGSNWTNMGTASVQTYCTAPSKPGPVTITVTPY